MPGRERGKRDVGDKIPHRKLTSGLKIEFSFNLENYGENDSCPQ